MTIIEAIILGIVQGLTEFLPISSSGHLIITERILGTRSDSLSMGLLMHLASLCAVVFYYRKTISPLVCHPFSKPVRLVITATIPTIIIVFALNTFFRAAFDGRYLVYCFLLTAILLMLSSRLRLPKQKTSLATQAKNSASKPSLPKNNANNQKQSIFGKTDKQKNQGQIGYIDAMIIGITQGLAALPGISRSGSTISASMLLGNDKKSSADFSFIISIPIILGSSFYELITNNSLDSVGFFPLLAGFLAAFISGFLSLKLLTKIIKNSSFDTFAIYLMCLSIFLLINDNLLFLF